MRAVLLFARSPHREAVAKRLPHGASLFRSVIAAWLRGAVANDAVPLIACAPEDRDELAAIEPSVAREWLEQRGDTFGDRVANATTVAFARGFTSVIVAAIDAPPVALDVAFAQLERGFSVIAPSRDGGINFIGLIAPESRLVSRFTPHRRDLVALCRRWFEHLVVLDAVTDVDSEAAMNLARRERAWRGYFESETQPIAYEPAMPFSRPHATLPTRAPPIA